MSMIRPKDWTVVKRNKGIDNMRQKGVSTGDHKASRGWGPNRNPSGDRSEQANRIRSRNPSSGTSKMGGTVTSISVHPARKGRNPSGSPKEN